MTAPLLESGRCKKLVDRNHLVLVSDILVLQKNLRVTIIGWIEENSFKLTSIRGTNFVCN